MGDRKKLMIMADDPRMPSGVGVQTSYIANGLKKYYDIVCVGGAINHPTKEKTDWNGITIYPVDGYGNPLILRNLITIEQPDGIMLFTDPRYWEWVWQMEDEIRTMCPIIFYHLWDDSPAPKYNRNFYLSCDAIYYISKQTGEFLKEVVPEYFDSTQPKWRVGYIPHGHPTDIFKPIDRNDKDYSDFLKDYYHGDYDKFDFIVLYNNRNIRRKMTGDVFLSFAEFVRQLPAEKRDRCLIVFHTHIVDADGTDLEAIRRDLFPDVKVRYSEAKLNPTALNYLYNSADVTINLASNEGYGIATAESLMAGTPIIINVTGGLQDQAGFEGVLNQDMVWREKNKQSSPKEWCYPCYPKTRSLLGSPRTPYIFDDRCDWHDVIQGLEYWYKLPRGARKELGARGREYLITAGHTVDEMINRFKKNLDGVFTEWTPRRRVVVKQI